MDSRFASTIASLFINSQRRLRSGWRFLAFVFLYLFALALFGDILNRLFSMLLSSLAQLTGDAYWSDVAGALSFSLTSLALALAVGYFCGKVFEDLPFRALGCLPSQNWLRDLLRGFLTGALALLFAAAIAATGDQLRFGSTFNSTRALAPTIKTLFGASLVFIISACAEETLFRGYPLQTLLRAVALNSPSPDASSKLRPNKWRRKNLYALLALVPTSILFALVHLHNPHVVAGLTFLNTMLAGLWLAVGYARARTLWFPIGLHFAWNYTQGALLGFPVSGITKIAPAPVLRVTEDAPAWLTGGDYGLEGGLACMIALAISTVFVWRAKWIGDNK